MLETLLNEIRDFLIYNLHMCQATRSTPYWFERLIRIEPLSPYVQFETLLQKL